ANAPCTDPVGWPLRSAVNSTVTQDDGSSEPLLGCALTHDGPLSDQDKSPVPGLQISKDAMEPCPKLIVERFTSNLGTGITVNVTVTSCAPPFEVTQNSPVCDPFGNPVRSTPIVNSVSSVVVTPVPAGLT